MHAPAAQLHLPRLDGSQEARSLIKHTRSALQFRAKLTCVRPLFHGVLAGGTLEVERARAVVLVGGLWTVDVKLRPLQLAAVSEQ